MRVFVKLCLPLGLLIFAVYKIADRYVLIPDAVAYPAMIISIICMMISIAYHGWCFGKHKNPYDFSKKTK